MWLLVATVLASATPPSAGRAVLDGLGPVGQRWLAQAQVPDPDEEQALEEDMARARQKLGHTEKQQTGAPRDPAQRSSGAAPSTDATQGATTGAAAQGATSDGPTTSAQSPAGAQTEDEGRRGRRARKARLQAPAPTIDGHGKAYFLTWGIVDWVLAADFWGAGALFALQSLGLYAVADSSNTDWTQQSLTRREMRQTAGVLGAAAVGLTAAGIFAAFRGGHNVGTFRDLRAGQVPGA